MQHVAVVVVLQHQVALVDRAHPGQPVHVVEDLALGVVDHGAVGIARDEQDLDLRSLLAQLFGQVNTAVSELDGPGELQFVGGVFFAIVPSVAWMAMLPMPIVIWGSIWFQGKLEPRYAEVRDHVSLLNAELANNLQGIATIKSFVAEDYEAAKARLIARKLLNKAGAITAKGKNAIGDYDLPYRGDIYNGAG